MNTDSHRFPLASSAYLRTAAVRFLGRSSRSSKCEGKVARDEIKFARTVAESIKEEMLAKRLKEQNAK